MLGLGRWGHVKLLLWEKRSMMVLDEKDDSDEDIVPPPNFHTAITSLTVCNEKLKIFVIASFADNLTYLILSPNSGCCCLVDPGDSENVFFALSQIELSIVPKRLNLQAILLTHKHWDHSAGCAAIKACFSSAKIYCGANEKFPGVDVDLKHGDLIELGEEIKIDTVAVPSHTRGSVIFYLRDIGNNDRVQHSAMFTGDTLFSGGCGAPFESGITDLVPMQRCFVELLVRTNIDDIDTIRIFPGHDYMLEMLKRQLVEVAKKDPSSHVLDRDDLTVTNSIKFPPAFYFTLMERLYMAEKKRGMRISNTPSYFESEFTMSTDFRRLRDLCEHFLDCLLDWVERNGSVSLDKGEGVVRVGGGDTAKNLGGGVDDITLSVKRRRVKPVFSTIYSGDLENLVHYREGNEERRYLGEEGVFGILDKTLNTMPDSQLQQLQKPGVFETDKDKMKEQERKRKKLYAALYSLGLPPFGITAGDSARMNLAILGHTKMMDKRIDFSRIVGVIERLYLFEKCATNKREKALKGIRNLESEIGENVPTAFNICAVLLGEPNDSGFFLGRLCCLCGGKKTPERYGEVIAEENNMEKNV